MRLLRPTSAANASIAATARPVIALAHCGVRVSRWASQRLGRVGVAREIGAVGEPVAKEDVHDRAGERAVRAGLQPQREVGLAHRLGVVDVDDDDLRAALLARARRVGHHVDLGRDRVGAPDDDDVGLRHFARIGAGHAAGPGEIARPGDADADRAEEARITLGVGQALDARRASPGPSCRRRNRARRFRRRSGARRRGSARRRGRAPRPSRSARTGRSPSARRACSGWVRRSG